MRIAILADPLDNQHAGIHVYTREMVDAMIRTNPGHEIILVREKHDPQLKGVEQIAIPNIRLPIGYASLRLFFIVPYVLHQKKADVVIEPAHFGPFNLKNKIKRVTIIHDLTPILFPDFHRWHSQFLQNIFLKRILNKTNLIITNSDNTSRDLCKLYPENCSKSKRIYPGKSKYFKHENNSSVFEKYKIAKPYFLTTGTIEPRKNLLVLLEAFRIYQEIYKSETMLVIVGGNGWKSQPFFDALKVHPYSNQIICTGFVDNSELPTLYSQAIALIYPSVYEGFGLPIIEAMSCGTPVITADNSSLPEAGGNAALFFNATNPQALATQMNLIEISPDLQKSLSEKAVLHASKFNWDNFGVEFWEHLIKLAKTE